MNSSLVDIFSDSQMQTEKERTDSDHSKESFYTDVKVVISSIHEQKSCGRGMGQHIPTAWSNMIIIP